MYKEHRLARVVNPPKANGYRFLTDGRWLTSLGERVEMLGEQIQQYEKTVVAVVLRDRETSEEVEG